MGAAISGLPPTLHSSAVPLVFQEPHVFTGYRHVNKSWSYYLRSLLQINNECINVWTHVFALFLTIHSLVKHSKAIDINDPYYWPFYSGYSTCLTLYFASVCAHLFHPKTELHHYVCFMIDYAGIGLYGLGSGMQHLFYCSEPWFYAIIKSFHIPVNVVLSCLTCFVSSYYKVRHNRPYPAIRKISQVGSVLLMYLWIVLPLFPRFATCYLQRMALTCDAVLQLHIKEIVWFFAAGVFYGTNIPHRWLPGVCDFIGHGHQIFHVCIMMTTFYANEAVFLDMVHKREQLVDRMPQSLFTSLLPIVIVFVIEIAMIYFLTGVASKKLSTQCHNGPKKSRSGKLQL